MNKKIFLGLFAGMIFLIMTNFISATLCQNSHGYYDDCSFGSYTSYNTYNTYRYASVPIFKGSYGNYRYTKYINGDDNPSQYFVSSGISYGRPFGGGYGYYGYPFNGGYYGYNYFGYLWYW